jgi:integrase
VRGSIRRRGKNSWGLKFELEPVNGKRQTQYVSCKGTRKDAERKLAELLAAVGAGSYVEQDKRLLVADYVMARIAEWHADRDIGDRSRVRYEASARNQIIPHLGARPLQKLTVEELEQWRSTLRARLSLRSTRAAWMVLSRALADAQRTGKIVSNPCKAAKRMKQKPGDVSKPVIVKDPAAFLEQLKSNPRFYALAALGLYAGLRLGEALALRDCYVDLDAGVIKVAEALDHKNEPKSPKTAAGVREVTMPSALVAIMRAHRLELMQYRLRAGAGRLEPEHLLFPDRNGQPLCTRTVSCDFGRLMTKIGRPEITFHGLRHSHASQLIAGGVAITTISKRLGHANSAITLSIYAHMFDSDDSAAAAALSSLSNMCA